MWQLPLYFNDRGSFTTLEALKFAFRENTLEEQKDTLAILIAKLHVNGALSDDDVLPLLGGWFERR